MDPRQIGPVLAIALRSGKNGPMREVDAAEATAGGGLRGDVPGEPDRGMTLLSARQWADVVRELRADLPWHTRRANVLIEAGGLAHLIGRTIVLGEVAVAIKGPSKPCGLMDRLHPGLRAALTPEGRGGVYGRVLRGGRFRVGDSVTLQPAADGTAGWSPPTTDG